VGASTKTVAATPDLWGIYTLQYETMDSMPVYRQHTYVCDPAALAAAAAAAGGSGGSGGSGGRRRRRRRRTTWTRRARPRTSRA